MTGGIASWVAPAATMVAATMTAANLGARVTGWGFAVFTLGSICWVVVGMQLGQPALIASNAFLVLVNVAGTWRWLGQQARYAAIADAAEAAGQSPALPSVVPATGLIGRKIADSMGGDAGEVVDAIIDCSSGAITYFVVRSGGVGGIGERIVALARSDVTLEPDAIRSRANAAQIAALPEIDESAWRRLLD
jgi:sporulation protein YlmC with PRC-barrel domain